MDLWNHNVLRVILTLSFTFKQSPRDKLFLEKVLRKSLYWFYDRDNFLKVFLFSIFNILGITLLPWKSLCLKQYQKYFDQIKKAPLNTWWLEEYIRVGGGVKNAIFRKKCHFLAKIVPGKMLVDFIVEYPRGYPWFLPKFLGGESLFWTKFQRGYTILYILIIILGALCHSPFSLLVTSTIKRSKVKNIAFFNFWPPDPNCG